VSSFRHFVELWLTECFVRTSCVIPRMFIKVVSALEGLMDFISSLGYIGSKSFGFWL
jgi:hypothetical protein